MSNIILPGKDCGLCGYKTCNEFAQLIPTKPELIKRCIHLDQNALSPCNCDNQNKTCQASNGKQWKDHLDREYDFILEKFPGETGPRETIILFNPANVEKLRLKKGDIIYGRPAWISCGCPVTHVGMIVEDPDYFNGTVIWNIVGPMAARENGINIGYYNTTAYEGIISESRVEIKIGIRYYFLPRYCMLQWRHCGLVNYIAKTPEGLRVRIEGLWIG